MYEPQTFSARGDRPALRVIRPPLDVNRCQACGSRAPTRLTSFNQHIGAVLLMFHREVRGRMCKRCIHQYFWCCTLVTLCFGWWGVISLFVTPIVLIANVCRYLAALRLKSYAC